MTELTKEQVEKWRGEFEKDMRFPSNYFDKNIFKQYYSDIVNDSWRGYLAAKKSDFEKIAELEKLSEMQARDAFSRHKEIKTLKEQLKDVTQLLRRIKSACSPSDIITCEQELEKFLEKQDKENKE